MNAVEMAPRAEAQHVLVGVVASVRAKPQVMRGDVTAAAAGTLAAVVIALVDVRVGSFKAAGSPGVEKSSQEKRRKVVFLSRGPR
jgi:hypothetical protein